MRFWDENRWTILAVGGVLFGLLVVYLAVLGPNAAAVQRLAETREEELKDARETFFPEESAGLPLRALQERYERRNRELAGALAELETRLSRPFPEGLVPAEKAGQVQSYLRDQLSIFRKEVAREVGSRPYLSMSEQAAGLGFTLSDELKESPEQARSWLKQLHTVREALALVLSLSEAPDGTPGLVELAAVQRHPDRLTGPEPPFVREFPVELRLVANQETLLRLLHACSQPEQFFVVQGLDFSAEPAERLSRVRVEPARRLPDGRIRTVRRSEHYYTVNLRLARVVVADLQKAQEEESAAGETEPETVERPPLMPY
jgi:hypothetical protein